MNLYSLDIKICATAYIKAETEEEALAIAQGMTDSIELQTDEEKEIAISGRQYDDPDLPDISISPAITFHGPWNEGGSDISLSEENIPSGEDEDSDDE
ncbi:hypothetical protein [Mesorhizobium sp. CN2-181]|uniref:hypothetical protein n=1 Tax=Mesorhizobium yinganensis TaxID=3157707 RepID=UPI0032B8333E